MSLLIRPSSIFWVGSRRLSVTRPLSSAPPTSQVVTELDAETGIATFCLNRPPVNSFNCELMTNVVAELEKVEKNPDIKGKILTLKNYKLPG